MNFHHDLNFDDVKGICKLKIPITVSKSYARERGWKREKKEERDKGIYREMMFSGMDVKMYFLMQYIQYQVSKKKLFGYVLDI